MKITEISMCRKNLRVAKCKSAVWGPDPKNGGLTPKPYGAIYSHGRPPPNAEKILAPSATAFEKFHFK